MTPFDPPGTFKQPPPFETSTFGKPPNSDALFLNLFSTVQPPSFTTMIPFRRDNNKSINSTCYWKIICILITVSSLVWSRVHIVSIFLQLHKRSYDSNFSLNLPFPLRMYCLFGLCLFCFCFRFDCLGFFDFLRF